MCTENLLDKYLKEINTTLKLRKLAAERLQRNDFWLQACNIYYSCFTAILAIVCLITNADALLCL